MAGVRPLGSELAGYRIEGVEREDAGAAVLRAYDEHEDREVALHVTGRPPEAVSTVRFLERARRIGSVEHPHLLAIYSARTLDGHAVAVTQAPPGRRLDTLLARGRLGPGPAVRVVRQVASAVDALEEAGAEPPPLTADRIWVDGDGNAYLDGLDASASVEVAQRAASSSAALARLLSDMTPRVPGPLDVVLTRAVDGAYLSAGQLADELGAVETRGVRLRRWVVTAVAVALAAAAVALGLLL